MTKKECNNNEEELYTNYLEKKNTLSSVVEDVPKTFLVPAYRYLFSHSTTIILVYNGQETKVAHATGC